MPGRKPTARAVKEMTGAAYKNSQRVNWSEPQGSRGYPEIPAVIASDPVALACWNDMCAQLDAMQLLVTSDMFVIQVAAMSYSQMIAINKDIANGNVTIENAKGETVNNPAVGHFHKFQDRFVRCLAELGLTPSSRLRLHAPDPEAEADEFQQWLSSASEGSVDS
jgi:P27 family predicted phage terminase small subunit